MAMWPMFPVAFLGMKVVRNDYIPKKKVPVVPHTDDMRRMVEQLQEIGAAQPQYKEYDCNTRLFNYLS